MLLTQSWSDDDLLTVGGADGFATFYRRHVDAMLRYHARSTGNAEVAASEWRGIRHGRRVRSEGNRRANA